MENKIKKEKKNEGSISEYLGKEKKLIPFSLIAAILTGAVMPLFGFMMGNIIFRIAKLDLYENG